LALFALFALLTYNLNLRLQVIAMRINENVSTNPLYINCDPVKFYDIF